MGKVYIKTRHSGGMIIPHNWNFANAMYGFRELGAEIIPYEHISEIYDAFTEHDIAIDYIDHCKRSIPFLTVWSSNWLKLLLIRLLYQLILLFSLKIFFGVEG